MPTKTRQKTRTKILAAGLELFQNPGYYNTDIRALAKTAGIALGSFYNYYPDKLHLYLDIYRQEHQIIAQAFMDQIRLGLTTRQDHRDLILQLLKFQASAHSHTRTFYLESDLLAISEPRVRELKDELDTSLIQVLTPVLRPLVKPQLPLDIALPLVYKLIEDTIHSLSELPEDRRGRILMELANMCSSYLFD